ncbi:AAA family ATPase [Arachnia propionica]|uniref:AAA family ATPase n=1 Tax=Arachnia propionica TaxID=1750 RepID=UPI000F6FF2EA|nr:ATP-binding protein [Arachnia propionica]VEJ59515.1 Predicted ATPase [Arachnia propionica]
MQITHVTAHNWRNFKNLDVAVADRLLIVGPNAAGKSNLLDLFRFLGDISRKGGGLAAALEARGGLSRARCLFARNNHKGELAIMVDLRDGEDDWRYELAIKGKKGGHNHPIVVREIVTRNGSELLSRPDANDDRDPDQLTQTHLEQISANREFRPIAEYFAKVNYFHLVPQMIRYPQAGGASPRAFGSSMIADMNATPVRTRQAWFRRIERALQSAVPGFETLRLEVDKAGQPHLIAGYRNWRRNPSEQNETDFSDGTLRLIGLLWTIISSPANGGVLLLEEPELSLNAAVVQKLASLLAMAQRGTSMQVILSTHSPELLDDEGIRPGEVLVLQVTSDATVANQLSEIAEVEAQISADLPLSEVVAELINPGDLTGLIKAARR